MKRDRISDDIQCRKYRPEIRYSHLHELMDNLPYILMVILGSIILFLGFESLLLSLAASILFIIYGIGGTVWFIIFICPYCHYFNTRSCPCGYGQISALFMKERDGSRFNEKFRKHIPIIVPLWIIPLIAGIVFLILDFSIVLFILLVLFVIDSYAILPLVSRIYGCAHCPQKDTCPWMK